MPPASRHRERRKTPSRRDESITAHSRRGHVQGRLTQSAITARPGFFETGFLEGCFPEGWLCCSFF